jgi:hypothetical protein
MGASNSACEEAISTQMHVFSYVSPRFDHMYVKAGRPSIPAEQLLRARSHSIVQQLARSLSTRRTVPAAPRVVMARDPATSAVE